MESNITVEGEIVKKGGDKWADVAVKVEQEFREIHPDADIESFALWDSDEPPAGSLRYKIHAVVESDR